MENFSLITKQAYDKLPRPEQMEFLKNVDIYYTGKNPLPKWIQKALKENRWRL